MSTGSKNDRVMWLVILVSLGELVGALLCISDALNTSRSDFDAEFAYSVVLFAVVILSITFALGAILIMMWARNPAAIKRMAIVQLAISFFGPVGIWLWLDAHSEATLRVAYFMVPVALACLLSGVALIVALFLHGKLKP